MRCALITTCRLREGVLQLLSWQSTRRDVRKVCLAREHRAATISSGPVAPIFWFFSLITATVTVNQVEQKDAEVNNSPAHATWARKFIESLHCSSKQENFPGARARCRMKTCSRKKDNFHHAAAVLMLTGCMSATG